MDELVKNNTLIVDDLMDGIEKSEIQDHFVDNVKPDISIKMKSMDEQTKIDLATMQLLFAKFEDKIAAKGFSEDAKMFEESCARLTKIIEKNFSETGFTQESISDKI